MHTDAGQYKDKTYAITYDMVHRAILIGVTSIGLNVESFFNMSPILIVQKSFKIRYYFKYVKISLHQEHLLIQ